MNKSEYKSFKPRRLRVYPKQSSKIAFKDYYIKTIIADKIKQK